MLNTASLLSGVPGLVASVAGPLVFKDAALVSRAVGTPDGRGAFTYTQTVDDIKALKSNKARGSEGGLQAQSLKSATFIILLDGLDVTVRAGAFIAYQGLAYSINSIKKDPASATLTCDCAQVGRYTGSGANLEMIIEA